MRRTDMLHRLSSQKEAFDFIIIGGGATGIGILLEAVTRGYTAVLFEASDFTKSTSGKSTKLIHGGVRYLAQGNIGLVREASIERGRLKNNAPHIVKNQSFIIPVFSFFDALLYTIGLKFYDLLAGHYSLGKSEWIAKDKVLINLPGLKAKGLIGGVLYHDGQFEDSRLALSCLKTAVAAGGIAINYMPVTGLLKDEKIKLSGLITRDIESGDELTIPAKYVINATGVFADSILEMDTPGHKKTIRPSQGIHLVIEKEFLPGNHALMIPKTEDGRVLFAVPWLGKVVLGTTDTPVQEIGLEPTALEEEIEFILRTASIYLTKSPSRKDVLSVFAGLRPLAETGESQKTKEISRSHKISVSDSGLFTIAGGKWTTFRKMAEDMINRVEKTYRLPATRSVTRNLPLLGFESSVNNQDPLHLFGSEAEEIRKIALEKSYAGWLSDKLQISVAQVVWSIRNEMVIHVEDILARRTRALLLDAKEAVQMIRPVAVLMAKELGHDSIWIKSEVENTTKLFNKYMLEHSP